MGLICLHFLHANRDISIISLIQRYFNGRILLINVEPLNILVKSDESNGASNNRHNRLLYV